MTSRPYFVTNDTAPPEIYTLSLHDALPIWKARRVMWRRSTGVRRSRRPPPMPSATISALSSSFPPRGALRSEEHTSELQSRLHLVCRLLLEKKKDVDHLLPHERAEVGTPPS